MLRPAQLTRGFVEAETARLRIGLFRVGSALLMLVVAAVIFLTGAVFLLSGIYKSLLQYTSPRAAGGIITLVSLLITALLVAQFTIGLLFGLLGLLIATQLAVVITGRQQHQGITS